MDMMPAIAFMMQNMYQSGGVVNNNSMNTMNGMMGQQMNGMDCS
jgi:hypothetical protein